MARKRKLIILACLISILPMKEVISQAEREEGKRNSIFRKRKFPSYNRSPYNQHRPTRHRRLNSFIIQEDGQHCVPNEIIVKLKVPLSDFELANLKEFQLIGTEGLPTTWEAIKKLSDDCWLIRIPENRSAEGIRQMFERNPIVKYAEPNLCARIVVAAQTADNKVESMSKAKIRLSRDSEGRLVMTNYSRFKSSPDKK